MVNCMSSPHSSPLYVDSLLHCVLQHFGVVLQAILDPRSFPETEKKKYYSKIIIAGKSNRNITLAVVLFKLHCCYSSHAAVVSNR